jgi:predicted aspartyl protease
VAQQASGVPEVIALFIGLAVLVASFPAAADEPIPSYCATAKQPLAQTICETPSLWSIDNEMNRLFDLAIAGSTPEGKKTIRASQDSFINEIVMKACLTEGKYSTRCIADAYQTRTAILGTKVPQDQRWATTTTAATLSPPPPTLSSNGVKAVPPGEVKISALNEGNAIYVWGRINGGPRVKMMLDTGASRTLVPMNYAGDIRLRDVVGTGTAVMANGTKEEFVAATLQKIEVIGDGAVVWVANLTASVGKGDDILLGRDFLKRFKSWSFDETTGTLTITGTK